MSFCCKTQMQSPGVAVDMPDILPGASGLFFLLRIVMVGVRLCQPGRVSRQEG